MIDLSNPTTQAYIGSVIRFVMASSPFIADKLSGDQISVGAGIVAAAIAFIWSLWAKKATADATHATVETAVRATAAEPENATAIIAQAKAGKF